MLKAERLMAVFRWKDGPKVVEIRTVNHVVLVSMLSLLVMGIVPISCGYGDTFSFAVIADPHIDGNRDRVAKFARAIEWIIDNRGGKETELVFIVGDIAWGGAKNDRNLDRAKGILDNLNVRVTDEPWYGTRWPESDDNELTVRWVSVDNSGSTISYSQHVEDVNDS